MFSENALVLDSVNLISQLRRRERKKNFAVFESIYSPTFSPTRLVDARETSFFILASTDRLEWVKNLWYELKGKLKSKTKTTRNVSSFLILSRWNIFGSDSELCVLNDFYVVFLPTNQPINSKSKISTILIKPSSIKLNSLLEVEFQLFSN